jgi:uncharacterized protein
METKNRVGLDQKIKSISWKAVTEEMHENGYSIIKDFVSAVDCNQLINQYNVEGLYRKTIQMERYRFGAGEYKYFKYPLPKLIEEIREKIYPVLSSIANQWMEVLGTGIQYPQSFETFQQYCRKHQQDKPTVLILKYGKGGHNTMHQDLYGDVFFPIQLVIFLDEPGIDYEGGEFVLLEQRPRAQSKAVVLKPGKGDILLFTTNFRPVKGSKGYYRVNMKHGVSQVHSGARHTLGIIFHDAQ